MSNMVANRLTIEGENVRHIILSLLTFDELGDEADFDFNKVIKMPRTVDDSTEWARKNWGCKDNALYTSVHMDKGIIEFETPRSPCIPVIEKSRKSIQKRDSRMSIHSKRQDTMLVITFICMVV